MLAALQQLGQRLEEQAATGGGPAPTPSCARMRVWTNSSASRRPWPRSCWPRSSTRWPPSEHHISRLVEHVGFEIHQVPDLPHSTRSVTDLRNLTGPPAHLRGGGLPVVRWRRCRPWYHPAGAPSPGGLLRVPGAARGDDDFAAALMIPEASAVDLLARAKSQRSCPWTTSGTRSRVSTRPPRTG
ncbi:hypothetical protein QJS66_16610 [Kocuria rhizophila]|nr:hypothetical protein QJS66_16610 [Kocuria rhizophila]